MKETRADTAQAFLYAIALHVLLFALALLGMWWTRASAPLPAAGSPIEAELVDANALSARMQRALRDRPQPVAPQPVEEAAPPPQPIPEPVPQEAPQPQQQQAQAPIPEPDTRDQEAVDRNAISAETRDREQQAKRRQEQIDLTERQRQEEAEQKHRLAQQQLDQKIKKIQAERAKVQLQADRAAQKLQQIADAQTRNADRTAQADASPPPGNNGADEGLQARYFAAIADAIQRNWTRPDSVPLGQRCKLNIRQIPGGEVIDVQVAASCPYDELGRRSVEAAVLKAQPLPYAGFEAVFSRNLNLNFEAQDR
ncbi:MAG: cell envelope integrity protein TolA [Luteimonas sp.]